MIIVVDTDVIVADTLFVEQPIRTGFSLAAEHAPIIHNEKEVVADFHGFLRSFIRVFNEYESVEVLISGESYAGAYIPWIANYILELQQDRFTHYQDKESVYPFGRNPEEKQINLKGVAIGNGIVDLLFRFIISVIPTVYDTV